MRSILSFIWKYNFVFLFLFLEFASGVLMVQNNSFHRASFINSSNYISAYVFDTYDGVLGYFGLRRENEILSKENKKLLSQSVLSFAKYVNYDFTYKDTVYKQQFTFQNARVINNSISRRNNYLTLNKGYVQGIDREMGVISSYGVVGIVKDVSDNFCTVLSVLHKSSSISAIIEDRNYFGSLVWDGEDYQYGTLKEIPTHVSIERGARILTSGYSTIFPKGFPVGRIVRYEVLPGDDTYTIKVKFSEDYGRLVHVYVVKNLLKEEQTDLESKTFPEK